MRHPERALELLGDRLERVGDEVPVQMQRRGRETARHPILVGAEPELELHLDRGPALRAEPADRVPVAPQRLRAVDRPGERLQERRLPGAVGPDDARDPGPELELRGGVLAKVDQPEPMQLHQRTPPSRPTCSTYPTPSCTNAARSRSASSGRCSRNSRTVSGSVCR